MDGRDSPRRRELFANENSAFEHFQYSSPARYQANMLSVSRGFADDRHHLAGSHQGSYLYSSTKRPRLDEVPREVAINSSQSVHYSSGMHHSFFLE